MATAAAHSNSARLAVVLWWYSSNIGCVILNKYLLSIFNFRFPVFLTMCHMAACWLLSEASIAVRLIKPHKSGLSRQQLLRVSVLSLVFCGSVVTGNISLKYIPVSFNQAIGATTPLFTALLSFVILGAVESTATYLCLLPVVLGIVLASQFEPSFHALGFTMAIMAASGRALKTVLQGLLLSGPSGSLDSMNLLRAMAPIACLLLVPLTLAMEAGALGTAARLSRTTAGFLPLLLLNMCMAYSVNLSNFLVTSYTSPLTAQVLGNLKGAVATAVSICMFRNPVTITGLAGYTITTVGCVMYSEAKKANKARAGRAKKIDAEVGMGWDRIPRFHQRVTAMDL